jgi:folate-dependent phosphoribosylglycinamide formyltransferase PurN
VQPAAPDTRILAGSNREERMAANADYRVLILTSQESTLDEVTAIGRRCFEHSTVVFWQYGNAATRPVALEQVEATDYNLVISHISGLILRPHHLARATYGAVNIHPAPPEHGGAFGVYCQPVVARSIRTHHGTTVHDMDEQIDHGPIYRADRREVPEDATIQDVVERSRADCLAVTGEVAEALGRSPDGSRCFTPIDERWDPVNRHHTVEDVRRWFAELDPAHPAHRERIPLNHPRAIASPPYFDDL